MPRSNVVITGMGVVSSIGIGCDAYFDSLLSGRSGITSLANRTDGGPSPDPAEELSGVWVGSPILDFEPKQYVRPRKALKVMCREIQTSFAASQMAVDSAGLSSAVPADEAGDLAPKDLGTVFGCEMFYGPPTETEDSIRACIREDGTIDAGAFGGAAMKNIMPLWMLKYLPNMPACHVGIALNAHGPNNTMVLGDVSGPAAVIEAASCIERGIAKVVIGGASGTRISAMRLNYRADLPIPELCDPIEYSSRPHDPSSTGVVGGEGAASLVLEDAEHAQQRDIRPIVRIVSYASRFVPSEAMISGLRTSDANKQRSRGSSEAIRLAIRDAMRDAEISSDQVALLVSHAMGDPVCDAAEREAIKSTVGNPPMVATIASIGHSGAACGTIDLVTGALALTKGVIPPTPHTDSLHPDVRFLDSPEPLQGDYVICVSFNSEGNAVAIVLGKA